MKIKAIILCTIILTSIFTAYTYFNRTQNVETVIAKEGNISTEITEIGYVEPEEEFIIEATDNGRILKVNASIGQVVKKGDAILKIENLDVEAQIASVYNEILELNTKLDVETSNLNNLIENLDKAKKDFERKNKLLSAKVISQAEFDVSENNFKKCKNLVRVKSTMIEGVEENIKILKEQLEIYKEKENQLLVKSPINGKILKLDAQEGEMVLCKQFLAKIGTEKELNVKTELLSDDMADVKIGQYVEIKSPVLKGRKIEGKVKEIYPQAKLKISSLGVEQRRVTVIISLNETLNLKAGYEVNVAIQTDCRENVLILPRESVLMNEKGEYEVRLVVDEKAVNKKVKVNLKNDHYIEITEGLVKGEQVLYDGSLVVDDGVKIKPIIIDK